MRIVLNTFGSSGDIHPYMRDAAAVSKQLKQENGPATAADLIEQVLGKTPEPQEELIYAAGD